MARLKSTSNLNVSVSQMDKENNSNNHHLLLGGELLSPSRPPLPPLLRYLRKRNGSPPLPLSPLDNIAWSPNNNSPTHYAVTPIKVDEDGTLVMDGIFLPSTGTTAGRFSRSSISATDSSPSSSSSSSGGRSVNKTDICRSWEESGTCRYGFKCQFAHGKEELRPPRFSARNKSDSSINRSKSRFLNQIMAVGGGMTIQTESPTKLPLPVDDTSCKIPTTTISIITSRDDWSPQDDGIEVVLPHSSTAEPPSQKDVDAYIHGVLYGPPRKRLPVFAEICSE
ncbi:uncharacterized protein LOC115969298 [Quercus lobata]|uniref:C3H1-type domain-containing protein n=1 Tax=Quercus lobata TaxID=97700 RepID=A0A7N2RD95_QUELO|nr:uncharacterized protein LOC115969298 [Quercus lobata]